jgi:hypothetical protein
LNSSRLFTGSVFNIWAFKTILFEISMRSTGIK